MKNILFAMILFSICSCGEKKNSAAHEKAKAELKVYEDAVSTEEEAQQLMKDYINDVNSADWKSKVPKYFEPSPELDAFMKEHTAFRTSFPNYKSTIKHMTIDGKEGIVWMNIKANYAVTYTYDNSVEVVKDIEAKNQSLSWDEAWAFSMDSDGTFGEDWFYLKDNHKILQDLKAAKEL